MSGRPGRRAVQRATPIQKNEEHRRNQHSDARRAGFREFSSRRSGNQGSRRSLNIVARRVGGTDCLPIRRTACVTINASTGCLPIRDSKRRQDGYRLHACCQNLECGAHEVVASPTASCRPIGRISFRIDSSAKSREVLDNLTSDMIDRPKRPHHIADLSILLLWKISVGDDEAIRSHRPNRRPYFNELIDDLDRQIVGFPFS
jgi:hypothetical protein